MVSVIVPIYNAQNTLSRCVDTILKQSYTDFELILVDDGSTDGSRAVCEDYRNKDSRVKVLYIDENSGVSAARNRGIEAATGEYIMFCDADDCVIPEALEICTTKMQKHSADIVMGGYYTQICKGDEVITSTPVAFPKEVVYEMSCFEQMAYDIFDRVAALLYCIWGSLYKSSVIKENKVLFAEGHACQEDYAFVLEYLSNVDRVVVIDKPIYYYFRQFDQDDVAKRDKIDLALDVETTMHSLEKILEKYSFSPEFVSYMYDNLSQHFIKLSEKIFMKSTGLTEKRNFPSLSQH